MAVYEHRMNIKLTDPRTGKKVYAVKISYSRKDAWWTPQLVIYKVGNHRITPYEFKRKGWQIATIAELFKDVYSRGLADIVYRENPMFALMKKSSRKRLY